MTPQPQQPDPFEGMTLFREREYVDAVMTYARHTDESPAIDPDAPISHPPALLVGLEGGDHDGEVTVAPPCDELILEDGEVYL